MVYDGRKFCNSMPLEDINLNAVYCFVSIYSFFVLIFTFYFYTFVI